MSLAEPPDWRPSLRAATDAWASLTDAQHSTLAEAFVPASYAARETVALAGSRSHDVLFVASGLLRFYYPGADGKEANKAFVTEGEFAGALAAAHLGTPLLYGVEALEPSLVLHLPYARFAALMDADAGFERLGRRLAEYILVRKERRARSLLTERASARYTAFAEAEPHLARRVPLYHIASYLGMTDVHLSRVRAAGRQAE